MTSEHERRWEKHQREMRHQEIRDKIYNVLYVLLFVIALVVLPALTFYLLATRGLNIPPLIASVSNPPSSPIQFEIPWEFVEYLIIVLAELTVIVMVSIFSFLRGRKEREENEKLRQAIYALVVELREEREERRRASSS